MPLRKGQAPVSFNDGKLEKHNFRNDPKFASECGKKGIRKAHEARERNKRIRASLAAILDMDVTDPRYLKAMKDMGIKKEDMTNRTFLMTMLLKKGFTGDVQAIKQIVDMVEGQTPIEETLDAGVIINVYPKIKEEIKADEYPDEDDGWG